MNPFARFLWRLLVASLGWLAAVAGSIATVIGAVLAATWWRPDAPFLGLALHGGWEIVPAFVAMAKVVWLGWFVFVLYAEVVALRALLAHLLAFAAIALLGAVALSPVSVVGCLTEAGIGCSRTVFDATLTSVPGPVFRLLAAAGFVAGFGHWLIAGASAGFADRPSAGRGDPRSPHA